MVSLALQSILAVALAMAVPAQERRSALVIVRDGEGQPVVGATVHCFAQPWFLDLEGRDDLVTAETGAGGRAVVQLLPKRSYALFASEVDGALFAASDVHRGLIAGAEAIVALGEQRERSTMTLEGEAAWNLELPLRLQVSPLVDLPFFLDVDANGCVPPMPEVRRVRVLDFQGIPLHDTPGTAVEEWKLRSPYDLVVRVTDKNGKAVEDAEVWQQIPANEHMHELVYVTPRRRQWRLLGTSDAKGEVARRIMLSRPIGGIVRGFLVEARKPGFTPGRSGLGQAGVIHCNGVPQAMPEDDVMPIILQPEQRLLLDPPGVYDVVIVGKLPQIAPTEPAVRLTTDERGQAPLPFVKSQPANRIALVTPKGERPIWTVVEQHGQCRATLDPQAVKLRVLDRTGNPARAVQAKLRFVNWRDRIAFDVPLSLDEIGLLDLRLNRGDWFISVRAGDDVAWRAIGKDEGDVSDTLKLAPIGFGYVRCVDRQGRPVEGVSLSGNRAIRRDRGPRSLADRFLHRELTDLFHEYADRPSDRDGLLRYPMLPLPGLYYELNVAPAGTWQTRVDLIVEDGETCELEIR